jgi:hypothetical protein
VQVIAPATSAQRRLRFLQQVGLDSGAYNVCRWYRLAGRLDERCLEGAVAAVVRRHEALHTSLAAQPGDLALVSVADPC